MPSVNIFIGGTGVKSAVMLRGRARFYQYEQTMGRLFALDTEPNQDGEARPTLGRDLVVAENDFAPQLQRAAETESRASWISMWRDAAPGVATPPYRDSFGFTVIRSGAETVTSYLRAQSGLYTLRAAGWLALQDILRTSPALIQQIVTAIQAAAAGANGQATILRIVASVAGGTGSGLFIPLITAIRNAMYELGQVTSYEVHLVLVTNSAFTNTWAKSPDHEILRTRGMSGTYAAFREVQFLARGVMDRYTPEERPLFGFDRPPTIDRVYWLGRRSVDADSTEEDTFFEASRVLALCNDDGFERLVRPQLGNFPHTQMPAVLTIEYPKYEIAQRLAAAAAVDLIDHMLKSRADDGEQLLALHPDTRGPILSFVYERRQTPQVLSSRAGAEQEPIAQDDLMRLIGQLSLPNNVVAVAKGNTLHPPSYNSQTDAEWRTYVGKIKANIEAKKRDDLSQTEDLLADARKTSANFVVQVGADAYSESVDPRSGVVSLGASRSRLQELTDAVDLAQTFFKRGVSSAVAPGRNADRRLRPSLEQQARANEAETRLLSRLSAEPARGWYFSPVISALLILIGLIAVGALVLQAAFPGTFRSLSASLPGQWSPGQQQLLMGALIGLGAGAAHAFWRSKNGKELAQVRREAEDRVLREWELFVVCRQAEMVFDTALAICQDAVGDTARRADPRTPEGTLGQALVLWQQAVAWLTELREVGLNRGQRADRQPPQIFRRVAHTTTVPNEQLRPFWPPVRAEAIVNSQGMNSLSLLDLRITPPNNVGALNVRDYRAPNDPVRNSDDVGRRIENLGTGFLTALEQHVEEKITDQNFLPETLEGMMGYDDQLNTPERLAESLNEMAREAQRRGAPGQLAPPPAQARSFFLVPDAAVSARVNEAVRLALARNVQGHYQYLESVARDDGQGNFCYVQRNVGQAIALVQLRHFGWPDQNEPQFQDIEEAAKVHYAVGAPNRGEDPIQNNSYNAANTEFYVLPELSAAARIEVRAGLTRPLASWIVPRLYGSHLKLSEVPTPLELFYLADHLGLLVREQLDTGMPMDAQPGMANASAPDTNGSRQPSPVSVPAAWRGGVAAGAGSQQRQLEAPIVRWHLLVRPPTPSTDAGQSMDPLSNSTFPLVEHALDGATNDALGAARPRLILFDAFLVAMGFRGGALDDARHLPVFDTWGGRMLATSWSQPTVYSRLRAAREGLLRHYFWLKKDPRPVYATMWGLVETDAALMPTEFGNEWRLICEEVLGEGLRRLEQQQSTIQPSTPA